MEDLDQKSGAARAAMQYDQTDDTVDDTAGTGPLGSVAGEGPAESTPPARGQHPSAYG